MDARVLVVENDAIIQLDLRSRLQRLGYVIVGSASSGEEAVAKAAELKPDLVLMDVGLDGPMDGIEAARRIQSARMVPVLYLTAYAGSSLAEHQRAPQPSLSKPFRMAEVQSAITRILGEFEEQQPMETGLNKTTSPS